MVQQLESLSGAQHRHLIAFGKLLIIFVLNCGRTCDDYLIAVGQMSRRFQHRWQVVLDFLLSAAAEKGDERFTSGFSFKEGRKVILASPCSRSQEAIDLCFSGISHVVDRVVVFLLEEVYLEGQYAEQLVDVALDVLDAVLLPRPNLRSNVVIDLRTLAFEEFRYLEMSSSQKRIFLNMVRRCITTGINPMYASSR